MFAHSEPRLLNATEKFLQWWRQKKVEPWIRDGDRILDVGCYRGEFLERLGDRIVDSIGIDPLALPATHARYRIEPMWLADGMPYADGSFDAIVLLATLEHIREKGPLTRESFRLLRPGGRVILTVPSPHVDAINDLLRVLHIAEGMSTEQHHGFRPRDVRPLFPEEQFTLEHHGTFQLGLNHLFVFRREHSSQK